MVEKSKLTIDQVALMAGVSRSVVSRVINNQPRVSEGARARVLKVIEEHDYRPSSIARSLASDRTYEICIAAPRRGTDAVASSYWSLLFLGISEQCMKRGYFVSLTMTPAERNDNEALSRKLAERDFDGYIFITQEVTWLVEQGSRFREVPMVLIGHEPSVESVSSIDVDNIDGAFQATDHLIGLGHRRIAAIFGTPRLQESIDRRYGFVRAMRQADLAVDTAHVASGSYSEKTGYDTVRRWLRDGLCASAIFCASDTIAMGALLALQKANVSVPDDVAIVGFDDLPASRYLSPPLTTVHQPIYEKGAQAADIIIGQIEAELTEPSHVKLPVQLVVRESCGSERQARCLIPYVPAEGLVPSSF